MVTVGLACRVSRYILPLPARIEIKKRKKKILEYFDYIQKQSSILDAMPVAVIIIEPKDFTIIYLNDKAKMEIDNIKHIFKFEIDVNNLIGISIDFFHKNPIFQRKILQDHKNLPHNAIVNISGQTLDLKISAITDSLGCYLTSMLTLENITEEVSAKKKLHYMANYDSLTDLPNRGLFFEKLSEISELEVKKCSVIIIDLDGFSVINDTYGHQEGDRLIKEFSNRLKTIEVKNDQYIFFSRFGGDEFLCLFSENSADEVSILSEKIVSLFCVPFDVGSQKISLNASVGIALMPDHGIASDILVGNADLALLEAKKTGKGRVCFFSNDLANQAWERVRISKKLRAALEKKQELSLFFQPIVDLKSNRVVARETLVRWNNPLRGWVSPAEFIPIAEQSDLIELLDSFVLEQACRAALSWQDQLPVSVNISAQHFGRNTIIPLVESVLEKTCFQPDRLAIEITETAELYFLDQVMNDLYTLRGIGVHISLDDFGTGYSSLSQIKNFPFSKIKIEGSFVRDAIDRPECAAVIGAVATLGRRLGVHVVAEGVETEAHHILVKAEGCSEGQGYFYGKPVGNGEI